MNVVFLYTYLLLLYFPYTVRIQFFHSRNKHTGIKAPGINPCNRLFL